jgi:hypothetical protein
MSVITREDARDADVAFLDAEVRDAKHAIGIAIGLTDTEPTHPGVRSHLIAARTQLDAVATLLELAA